MLKELMKSDHKNTNHMVLQHTHYIVSKTLKPPPPTSPSLPRCAPKDSSSLIPYREGLMGYHRSAKSCIGIIRKGVTSSRQSTRSYSSSAYDVRSAPLSSNHGIPMLARTYNVDVSGLDQMGLIRRLRERTSAPIKDVKSSLVACNWDIEEAHKDLRKRGVVLAMKKSARTAAEGLLALAQTDNKIAVVELNCETDFVARNEIFQYMAGSLARIALCSVIDGQQAHGAIPFGPELLEDMTINLDHPKLNGETTIQNAITELAAMVGENVKLRRGFTLSASSRGIVSSYLHASPQSGLGRISGLVTLEVGNENASLDALKRVGSSLAMHIVAAKPLFLSKDIVPTEAIEAEREILKSQAEGTGKSPIAIEKMTEGRLRKYFEDVVLLEQKYVVNDTMSIKSVLSDLSKEVGSSVEIGSFFRMEVGEGIQRT